MRLGRSQIILAGARLDAKTPNLNGKTDAHGIATRVIGTAARIPFCPAILGSITVVTLSTEPLVDECSYDVELGFDINNLCAAANVPWN